MPQRRGRRHAILSGAFKLAQVWGWRGDNPVALSTRPAVDRADVRPPGVRDAERLVDAAMAEDPELGLFVVLAVVLGARRGEACRLRWSHVDLEHGEVLVGGASSPCRASCGTRSGPRTAPSGASPSARPWWSCCDGGRTTLGTYAHFQQAQDQAAAELIEGLIRLPRSTSSG